jgi:hypothetical protein
MRIFVSLICFLALFFGSLGDCYHQTFCAFFVIIQLGAHKVFEA